MTHPQPIHLLPPEVANQIAAGEVVERPASVLKELLENALDAKATAIVIELLDAGLRSIRVRDNGTGILKEDLVYAITRHATSKITCFSDVMHLKTLGFRGEALASIASVSRFSLTSATGEVCGYRVQVGEEAQQPTISPLAHPVGTTVAVTDLFYKTPARRKFLKGIRTEWYYIQEVIAKMALSHPLVSFQVFHQNKKGTCWPFVPIERWQERVAQVLGSAFLERGLYFETKTEALAVWGWLIPPGMETRQREQQYTFVNTRAVRDKVIQHAIKAAFLTVEGQDVAIQIVLFVEIDPTQLDVNVHPTKHEVRFHQARLVHDVIEGTLRETLAACQPVEEGFSIESFPLTTSVAAPWGSRNAFPMESAGSSIRLGPYSVCQHAKAWYILDLPKVAAWWIKECYVKQKWELEKLMFPEVCKGDPDLLDYLETASGQSFCQALCLGGQRIGPDQWKIEYLPSLLSTGNTALLMQTVWSILKAKGTALACVAEWALVGAESLLSTMTETGLEAIVKEVLVLPATVQKNLVRSLTAEALEKLFQP